MKIRSLRIQNFKSIRELVIEDADHAFILVGKNNTGKTVVLDAIRAAAGEYKVTRRDFLHPDRKIVIHMTIEFTENDLLQYHRKGVVSKFKRYDLWFNEFKNRLPSFKDNSITFDCIIYKDCSIYYQDMNNKDNPYIKDVFPKIYYIDHLRNLDVIQEDILRFYDKESVNDLRENICIFNNAKSCNQCFHCIGVINKKSPELLTVSETVRLLEYKLFQLNINQFSDKLNKYFHANGNPSQDIQYVIEFNVDELINIHTKVYNSDRGTVGTLDMLSEGIKSIYVLSLLETYIDGDSIIPSIIMIEDPEIYLHPQLQKSASEILYRLSKKNQVIFTTHAPNMIFNFSMRQIKQVLLDKDFFTIVNESADIDEILDDLGYNANDLMNVSFVFIVEGKQDSSRLPLLLERYYSEIYDEKGNLQRIAIINTNSCTNIKTYANLKYINKLYLKEQFLMIRDGDGKDPMELKQQLCSYYKLRNAEDLNNLPRVMPRNVLVLKYYSFENYFLDPKVMEKIGVISEEEEFYNILYSKYCEYLHRLTSTKHMMEKTGIVINSVQDVKDNLETIKIYMRGHNLYDIFYSKYRRELEQHILKKYIEAAPRETFSDILESIDSFVYFGNRKKQ